MPDNGTEQKSVYHVDRQVDALGRQHLQLLFEQRHL